MGNIRKERKKLKFVTQICQHKKNVDECSDLGWNRDEKLHNIANWMNERASDDDVNFSHSFFLKQQFLFFNSFFCLFFSSLKWKIVLKFVHAENSFFLLHKLLVTWIYNEKISKTWNFFLFDFSLSFFFVVAYGERIKYVIII